MRGRRWSRKRAAFPRNKHFIGSTSRFADRGSLALNGVAPLAHYARRAAKGPVAGRGSFWQVSARAYALSDIRSLPQDSATWPEASPYQKSLAARSALGSNCSLVRGSRLHLLLPMRATRAVASPYRTPLGVRSTLGSDGSLVRGSLRHPLLPTKTMLREQQWVQRP
jgi:hypothetical protein